MKTLLYLHGFASSGASGTVELLRHEFSDPAKTAGRRDVGPYQVQQVRILAPDIPVDPQEALPFLRQLVEQENPGLIVGTSMGGMYAQQLRGYPRICVNPSFGMSKLYSLLHVGKYKWLNKRKDGSLEFHIYKETIEHFAEMEAHQFDGLTEDDQMLCFGLFGSEDTITAPCRAEFEAHYPGQLRMFEGGHRLNADLVHAVLIPLIKEIGV